jgi:hypothetical protein
MLASVVCVTYSVHMHKIISANISYREPMVGEDIPRTKGFVIAIEPPVHLNPDIVEPALRFGRLEQGVRRVGSDPFGRIALIGSSEERTVIYAQLFHETSYSDDLNASRSVLVERTADLLSLMGVMEVEFDQEVTLPSHLV